jgi:hypothetical protein
VFQIETKCNKFSALKEIAKAKKERRWPGTGLRVCRRRIRNRVEPATTKIEGLGLSAVERAGTTAAEDGELVAGFIDSAISIDALRDG